MKHHTHTPKIAKIGIACGLISSLLLLGATAARADFIDYQVNGSHHQHGVSSFTSGGARYTKAGNLETFEHLNTTCNRVEHDTDVHYKTGVHTFTGDLKIGTVTNTICVQIFNAPASGPIIFLRASSAAGGTLKKYGGGQTVATGISGKFIAVKIVHDLNANTIKISINGSQKINVAGGKGGSFNLKYGNYGTGAPTKTQWRDANW